QIPSIITSSIIVIYIIVTPAFRSKEQNHSTCVLLSFNFLQLISDIPLAIHFFRLNIVQPATSVHCILWTWLDFALNTSSLQLMAWISIERHLFIFSWNLMHRVSRLQRWFIHFAPLIICSVWCPIFYFFAIIVSPMCANTWIFYSLLCGLPCYLTTNLGYYDLIFNTIMPVLFILIANVALVIRVVKQKLSRKHFEPLLNIRIIVWQVIGTNNHRKTVVLGEYFFELNEVYRKIPPPMRTYQSSERTEIVLNINALPFHYGKK
ncbi:unnamed protein product, partial [Rotaria magnacalcarata]